MTESESDDSSVSEIDSSVPTIDGLQFIRKVGEGGMATVYQARQDLQDRLVAVKVISNTQFTYTDLQRFLTEAQNTGTLDHPNIIKVYRTGIAADKPYLVMEYLYGKSLQELLSKSKKLSMDEFERVFMPLLSALEYAHDKGLVHRDIKPGNIFLQTNENSFIPKLIDFGIAKQESLQSIKQKLTTTGHIVGSPKYMSPEQIDGISLDGRSDQYALACVMHEAILGKVPFESESVLEVLYKHVREPVTTEKELKNACGGALAAVIIKALSKDRERRYENTKQFAQAVRKNLLFAKIWSDQPLRRNLTTGAVFTLLVISFLFVAITLNLLVSQPIKSPKQTNESRPQDNSRVYRDQDFRKLMELAKESSQQSVEMSGKGDPNSYKRFQESLEYFKKAESMAQTAEQLKTLHFDRASYHALWSGQNWLLDEVLRARELKMALDDSTEGLKQAKVTSKLTDHDEYGKLVLIHANILKLVHGYPAAISMCKEELDNLPNKHSQAGKFIQRVIENLEQQFRDKRRL